MQSHTGVHGVLRVQVDYKLLLTGTSSSVVGILEDLWGPQLVSSIAVRLLKLGYTYCEPPSRAKP